MYYFVLILFYVLKYSGYYLESFDAVISMEFLLPHNDRIRDRMTNVHEIPVAKTMFKLRSPSRT